MRIEAIAPSVSLVRQGTIEIRLLPGSYLPDAYGTWFCAGWKTTKAHLRLDHAHFLYLHA